jgi:hypothetical protein
MKNPFKPMPGAGVLISDSWKFFVSNWNASLKTSLLFLYAGLVVFAASVLLKYFPSLTLVYNLIWLLVGIGCLWIGIRLFLTVFSLEAGKKPLSAKAESLKALSLLLPFLWVAILSGLVIFGGFVLLIVPGIYFSIALYFGQIIFIDKNIRGTQALAASRALIKGRWWPTLWRILAGSVVFGILVAVINELALSIFSQLTLLTQIQIDDPMVLGGAYVISAAVQAAFAPLAIGFQIKLYRALQKTK